MGSDPKMGAASSAPTVFILYGARPTVVGFGQGVYSETCSEANVLVELGEIPSLHSGQALRFAAANDMPKASHLYPNGAPRRGNTQDDSWW